MKVRDKLAFTRIGMIVGGSMMGCGIMAAKIEPLFLLIIALPGAILAYGCQIINIDAERKLGE